MAWELLSALKRNQRMIGKNMIGFSAKAKAACVAGAVCAFFFAAFGGTFPIEQDFPDYNCGITFPEGWHVMANVPSRPDMIAAYCDASAKRIVNLVIYNKRPPGPLDDRFTTAFDQQLTKDGDILLSGKYIEVGGIKSYQRLGSFARHGHQISSVNLVVPGEDRYYIVQGLFSGGDANEDPEIQQALGSFRFLHPFVPTYNSIAFRIGQLTGYLIVILVVVAIVIFAGRSNRTPSRPSPRPPSQPPPVPPGIRLR